MTPMISLRHGLILMISLACPWINNFSFAEDGDTPLETQCRECAYIVLGHIVAVEATEHLEDKTISHVQIRVVRYLKGDSENRTIGADVHCESSLEMKPDGNDVIWFIRQKMGNGRCLITDGQWGSDSLYSILDILALVDKKTRIPGMPKPPEADGPISLALAIDNGEGNAIATTTTTSPREVSFLVQFENRGKSPHSVMPCLDGSALHKRYPHYDMEVIDSTGQSFDVSPGGGCGNINPFTKRDVVSLQPGEVFRTWARKITRRLEPGKYKIRLRYAAKRDLNKRGGPLGDDDPEMEELIKTVWEGTIQSNWIEIEILPEEKGPEK